MLDLSLNEWAVLIGIVVIVVFFVIPQILREQNIQFEKPKPPHYDENLDNALAKVITDAAVDPIGYPKPAGKGLKSLTPSEEMIAKYYTNSSDGEVPRQNPLLPIGACPFSKEMSTDLPMANVPMSMAQSSNTMRLRKP